METTCPNIHKKTRTMNRGCSLMQMVQEVLYPWCIDEYSRLKSVCMCSPTYLSIKEIINETQRFYAKQNIRPKVALEQYGMLRNVLKKCGVQVFELEPQALLNEQTFTRDIAFTIGNKVYLANLKEKIRKDERDKGQNWFKEQRIPFEELHSSFIEGGDLMIDQRKIWVGVSGRTTQKAVHELRTRFPKYDIHEIVVPAKYLHLDCVFNIIAPNLALIYSPAFQRKDLDMLANHYELIEVQADEQFTMGTNVLSLGEGRIISQPKNDKVNYQLRNRGFEVISVDLSEINKSGGGVRCLTLPISRTKQY